jgi:hypothetical protein
MHQSILTKAALQSRDPAAREKRWPVQPWVSRTQSVGLGAARAQSFEERVSILGLHRQTPYWPLLHRRVSQQMRAYRPRAQQRTDWLKVKKWSVSQLLLRQRSRWGAAVQPSRHDAFPATPAVLFAAE